MIQGPNSLDPSEIFLHAAFEEFVNKYAHEDALSL